MKTGTEWKEGSRKWRGRGKPKGVNETRDRAEMRAEGREQEREEGRELELRRGREEGGRRTRKVEGGKGRD